MIVREGLILKLNLSKAQQVRVIDFIGVGGFSDVWKVQDTQNNNIFALKHIRLKHKDPGEVARTVSKITEEAKINLPSSYIVKAFGLSVLDEKGLHFAILFEYVDGVELNEWIQKNKYVNWKTKLNIYLKILEGIAVAHQHGIYHKDLKPENIIITKNNCPKILDFGLASTKDKNVTRSRGLAGTLSYLAPESLLNIKTYERFDIYSLGCILYDLYRGDNYLNICGFDLPQVGRMMGNNKLLNGSIIDFDSTFPNNNSNEKKYKRIIKKATSFKPENRYSSVDELLYELKREKNEHKLKLPIGIISIIIFGLSMSFFLTRDFSLHKKLSSTSTTYFCMASGLHIRADSTTNSIDIGGLKFSEEIKVISIQHQWAKIEYNDTIAYVGANYIAKTLCFSSDSAKYLCRERLKVREFPFTHKSSGVLGELEVGEEIDVFLTDNNWAGINYFDKRYGIKRRAYVCIKSNEKRYITRK